MKKILVLLMIFMLSFSLFGCGGEEESEIYDDGPNITDIEADDEDKDDSDTPEVLDPDDLTMKDDDYDYSLETKYDFNLKADKGFAMDSIIEKVSYKDLSGLQSTIQSRSEQAAAKVFSAPYSFTSDYESDSKMDFDELTYVMGIEGDDFNKAYTESGVYHEKATGKYHQYTSYTSATYYEYSDSAVEAILTKIKRAYGINVSEKKVKKAAKEAYETAKTSDDFCSLVEKITVKGNGCTETVTLTVDGFVNEGDEGGPYGFYIYVDRDRVYN